MKKICKYIGFAFLGTLLFSCDPEPINDKELIDKQLKLTLDEVIHPDVAYEFAYDREGNEYKTVEVGDYEWFAQNLRVTQLNDGTPIKHITDNEEWNHATEPAYCSYKNRNKTNVHGMLYNYKVVETGKLCPIGWEVPNDSLWLELTEQYSGEDTAGVYMKSPNVWFDEQFANNRSGFSAVPSGLREKNGRFYIMGENAFWWSSTPHNAANAMYFYIDKNTSLNHSHMFREFGLSVRCVRKNE
ncbi:MAG: fibrobacter succinogenes major paralogous domain-containing protein [Bacteroidales bacterium]